MAYRAMNGVMADSVSSGSSQRGASVTWAAMLTWPSGAAATRVDHAGTTATARQLVISNLRLIAMAVGLVMRAGSSGKRIDAATSSFRPVCPRLQGTATA